MPTYEYECLPNGHRFEVKQSFSDPSIEVCEVCDEPVRKVFSAAGIVFKGSGYYVTDTRKAAKSAKSAAAAGGDSTATKSDAKSGGASDATPAKTDSGSSTASSSTSSSSSDT